MFVAMHGGSDANALVETENVISLLHYTANIIETGARRSLDLGLGLGLGWGQG